jgi:hypothetical protein
MTGASWKSEGLASLFVTPLFTAVSEGCPSVSMTHFRVQLLLDMSINHRKSLVKFV